MTGFIKKIEKINFGLMSPEDIRSMSVVTVETPDTYEDDGFPIEKGLMDSKMGVTDPSLVCGTCGLRGGDCQGHFGSIELARPVIHVGFSDVIYKILRSTCNECGRVLLNEEQIVYFTEKIHEAVDNRKSLTSILQEVYRVAKRGLRTMPDEGEEVDPKHCCPHCGAPQEAIFLDKPVTIRQGDYRLTASEVRERLERITDDDSFILGVNPDVARPEWLVLTVLPVPPVTVRPSIPINSVDLRYDDLTHKLVDILRINQRLLENMEAGAPQLIVDDLWELLQYHVTTYFDNEASGVPPARHRSGRILKTLTQRLKGKEGRFRSNLSGKRVNFSARTVISPDPNISINEVGVPEMIAKEITVPIHITDLNIGEIRKFVKNGLNKYPGATRILRADGNIQRIKSDSDTEYIANNIKVGDVVERNLIDGDIVLLNRQPSLHKLSMLAHEVRILPYKTFRLNPCVCPPYNADFDGDEINMHVLQSVESRSEAASLMKVQDNIISPRFGGPIIGAIHDHISGAFLLTRTGSLFTEEEALQIIRKSHLKLPTLKGNKWILKEDSNYPEDSFIYKNKGEMWTGKELFSLLLPNDLNLSYTCEIAKGNEKIIVEEFDEKTGRTIEKIGYDGFLHPTDGYVVIENGILKQGVIDESAFGSFSGKLLDKLIKSYDSSIAKEFLDKSTKMAICAIMKVGITTSLNDEEIPDEAQHKINEQLELKIAEIDDFVYAYEKGYLQPLPGRSLEETLELRINNVLGEARDSVGRITENYILNKNHDSLFSTLGNNSAVMAKTGANASMLNLTQITACVGQQSVRGRRIERGYLNRALPHFKKGELGAKAKGFIYSSYKSGLDPIEFFFHAVGGREGLVDKEIRTSQSGYMQRRLVNALQNLSVDFKGVVKDTDGNVIQTIYGEDGVDPAKSDFGKPANLNKLIEEIRSDNSSLINNFSYEEFTLKKLEEYDELYISLLKDFEMELESVFAANFEFFKQEIINENGISSSRIAKLNEFVHNQINKENIFKTESYNLYIIVNKIKGNFNKTLNTDKKRLEHELISIYKLMSDKSKNDELSSEILKINNLYDNLMESDRIDNKFNEKLSGLKLVLDNFGIKLNNNREILEEYESRLDINKSKYKKFILKILQNSSSNLKLSISNLKNKEKSILNRSQELYGEINILDGNFTQTLTDEKEKLKSNLSKIFNDSNLNGEINKYSEDISKINRIYAYLLVNGAKSGESGKIEELTYCITSIHQKIRNYKRILNEFESQLKIEESNYKNLIKNLEDRKIIISQLMESKKQISDFDINKKDYFNKSHEIIADMNDLKNKVLNIENISNNDLQNEKDSILYSLNNLINEINGFDSFERDVDDKISSVRNLMSNLENSSKIDDSYMNEFSEFESQINEILIDLKNYENKLKYFEEELTNQKSNYEKLVETLNNQNDMFDVSLASDDEVYDKLRKYIEFFESGLISQDEFDELKRKLIFGSSNNEENESQNNEFLNEFKDFINSFSYNIVRNSANISDEDADNVLKDIESKIIVGEITEGNIKTIIQNHFEEYANREYVKILTDRLMDFVENSNDYQYLSNQFNDLSLDEKSECIDKLKNSFNSDFKPDDIESSLKIIFENKRKEKRDLNSLDDCRANINVYMSRYNLFENEVITIFDMAQYDIIESNLGDMEFEQYLSKKFKNKVNENKKDARYELSLFFNKKSKIKELTKLDNRQINLLNDDLSLLISQNKLRKEDINENLLIDRSIKYKLS